MNTLTAILCAVMAFPAMAQGAEAVEADEWNFDQVQHMLDRFSDTTMRSIEEQLRKRLDEYERAMEGARDEAPPVTRDTLPATYRLAFEIADISAPISVLSTHGSYSVDVTRDRHEKAAVEGASQISYMLTCNGEIQPGGTEAGLLVTFAGQGELIRLEYVAEGSSTDSAQITFSGSSHFTVGQQQEIARNDTLAILLTIDEVKEDPPLSRRRS
jgi:hypothetical protein